jgi:GNAT superfamily N-acetyltransferase
VNKLPTMPCNETHTAALARMLALAFRDDPLYQYVFDNPAARADGLLWDMEVTIRYGMRFGEVHAATDMSGCAVWLPPGETDFTEERMAQVGMLDAASWIGEESDRRLGLFIAASELVHRRIVPAAHWYLVLLGVDPRSQGQGIGSALLAGMLSRADEGRYPVYLETLNRSNLHYYGKRGFTLRHEEAFVEDGPTIWYMVREPAPLRPTCTTCTQNRHEAA